MPCTGLARTNNMLVILLHPTKESSTPDNLIKTVYNAVLILIITHFKLRLDSYKR